MDMSIKKLREHHNLYINIKKLHDHIKQHEYKKGLQAHDFLKIQDDINKIDEQIFDMDFAKNDQP